MSIIANAGMAKSSAMEAIAYAHDCQFEKARELIDTSENYELEAHRKHSQILTLEANGELVGSGVLVSHAQDQFMLADFAREIFRCTKSFCLNDCRHLPFHVQSA